MSYVNGNLGNAVGAMFVEKYFDENSKHDVSLFHCTGWSIWPRTLFDDIKSKVPQQYELLVQNRNSDLNVNKRLSLISWTTLYVFSAMRFSI